MVTFPVPEGIPSSVTFRELALLQRYAHEAGTVLEIGTQFGFSCIGMALAGAHVTSVDPHDQGTYEVPDTWESFLANCERHGFDLARPAGDEDACLIGDRNAILAFRRPIELLAEGPDVWQGPGNWRLVFIDGDHVWPAPWRDAEIAMAHLAEGGWLAFHDVTVSCPGVWRATRQLEAAGWRCVDRERFLRIYQK